MFIFGQETGVYRNRQRRVERTVPAGIHSSRLAASKAHRRFVTETRKAVQKLGWEIPDSALLSPSIVGAQLLRFPVAPNLERAFGYRGNLRFLELGYCVRSRLFGIASTTNGESALSGREERLAHRVWREKQHSN